MIMLPGWDAIESASRWHSFYEVAGIVALALLVVFEILAYQYGHRRDELQAVAETRAAVEAGDAKKRHENELTELKQKLVHSEQLAQKTQDTADAARTESAKATSKLSEIEAKETQRTLTEGQASILKRAIAPFRGAPVYIFSPVGNREALIYAEEFATVFNEAGWEKISVSPTLVEAQDLIIDGRAVEIETQVNKAEASSDKTPPLAIAFAKALFTAKLTTELALYRGGVATGAVSIIVHSKPRSN